MSKALPKDLTSYDFLKALAIILMVADHIGFYFYPDDMWFRTFGRLSVPVWFFLIGYAKTRDIPRLVWVWAGLAVLSSLVAGQYLFPLNILFTLMAARWLIDAVMARAGPGRALRSYETLAGMFFILLLLSFPTGFFIEYGSLAGMFAMYGYMMRRRKELELGTRPVLAFVVAAAFSYIVIQGLLLPSLSGAQALTLIAGMALICAVLAFFRPLTFPRLTSALPFPLMGLIKLMGRRTMEIYVLHLVLLRAVGMVLDPERFGLYDWAFFPPGAGEYFRQLFF